RLCRGRAFTADDRADAPLVGIVNERMVREFFPGEEPIGRRIRWARQEGEPRWIEIVGVAADVTHFGLAAPERPAVYTPYAPSIQSWKRWMVLVLRSRPGTPDVAGEARRRIWSVDPLLPVSGVRTMDDVLQASLSRQ